MNKKCPHCRKEMSHVDMLSHYGINIMIDQCAICGGMWFDNAELYQIDPAESTRADFAQLSHNSMFTREITCPNDATPLESFHDPQYPKTLTIKQCPTCFGTWLNRGEFHAFSAQRQKIVAQNTPPLSANDREYQDALRKIMHDSVEKKDLKRVQHLVDFLAGSKPDAIQISEQVDEMKHAMNLFTSRGSTFIRGMSMIARTVPLPYQPIAGLALLIALILDMTYKTLLEKENLSQ